MTESVPSFDLYAILNVSPDASTETVVAAHRALIRTAHPDRDSTPGAVDRTKRLNVARDWLADPARRRQYDIARGVLVVAGDRGREPSAHGRGTHQRAADDLAGRDEDAHSSWARSPSRAELELFVVRCGELERRDADRLLREYGRLADPNADLRAIGERLVRRSHELGRGAIAHRAAEEAVRRATRHRHGRGERLAELLRWTAFAYAVTDSARLEALVFIGPWERAMRSPSAVRTRPSSGGRVAVAILSLLALLLPVPPGYSTLQLAVASIVLIAAAGPFLIRGVQVFADAVRTRLAGQTAARWRARAWQETRDGDEARRSRATRGGSRRSGR